MQKVKWGILGAANIGVKFISDLKLSQTGEIIAVGASTGERAELYAKKMGIPKFYDSYNRLVADADIDIIYIATTHNFHFEHAKLCLENNKNVLCEKPVTVNAKQFEVLITLAKSRNLFFMEAMWTAYLPAIIKAQTWVSQGLIGKVQLIQANFGFTTTPQAKPRLFSPELAGGALLDIGIYPLTFIEMFAQAEIESVNSVCNFTNAGVDESLTVQLKYKNGIAAQMACTIAMALKNSAIIYGTKGHIELPNFWMAKEAHLTTEAEQIQFNEDTAFHGYLHEIEAVNACILSGLTEQPVMPPERSLSMLKLMDFIRAQIGLVYPFEQNRG